jgi:hypothetical protein
VSQNASSLKPHGQFKPYSCGGIHLGFRISIKNPHFLEDLQMIIPGQFGFNCPSGLREENYKSDLIQTTLDSPLQSFGFLF